MANVINRIMIQALTAYQQHVSPIKGFCCASGALHGDTTCSRHALDAIKHNGLIKALPKIATQLKRCQHAAQHLKGQPMPQAAVFCCVLPIPL